MIVQVKLFALAKQLAGHEVTELDLPPGSTIADLRRALAARFPELSALAQAAMIAVDMQYVGEDVPLNGEQEIAVIPPVSGG